MGLQNYSDGNIAAAIDAVRAANVATSFAGLDDEAAVETAAATARQAPPVQQVLAASQPFCLGDCNQDRAVTVNEMVVLVDISMGGTDLVACIPGNRNADTEISVNELVGAVDKGLKNWPR